MVWRSVYDEKGKQITGLIPIEQAETSSRSVMEWYDSLSERERDELKQDTLHKRERWRGTDNYVFTVRTRNVLQMENFERHHYMEIPSPKYVWEQGRDYWRKRPNCGLRSVHDIANWLATHGLSWPEPGRRARKKRVLR